MLLNEKTSPKMLPLKWGYRHKIGKIFFAFALEEFYTLDFIFKFYPLSHDATVLLKLYELQIFIRKSWRIFRRNDLSRKFPTLGVKIENDYFKIVLCFFSRLAFMEYFFRIVFHFRLNFRSYSRFRRNTRDL